ncbi:MAG: thioredoxin family protein [Bacillota bacterium]|jgi:small redox-active disulfide protein 2
MKIEVLGSGCAKCRKTEEMISETVKKLGIKAEVVHVTNIGEIVERGIMMTPAVVIDGKTMIEGKVPSEAQIRAWFGR